MLAPMFGLLQSVGLISLLTMAGGGAVVLRRWLARFGDRLAPLAGPPVRLRLSPAPLGLALGEPRRLRGELLRLGFVEVGAFHAEGLPRLRLLGLVHPGRGVSAAIWTHSRLGVWLDLWVSLPGPRRLVFTTDTHGAEITPPPWTSLTRLPDHGPEELLRALTEAIGDDRPLHTSPERYADDLQRDWAAEADWRNLRGPTEDEITRLVRAHGQAPTAAELRRARRALNRAALHGLDLALRERLDWRGTEAEEDRLLFVYERLGEEGLMERLGALADAPKLGEGPDLRARFAAWVAEQPEAQRFRRLAAVQGPVEAEAWLAPG